MTTPRQLASAVGLLLCSVARCESVATDWVEFALPLQNYAAMEPTIAARMTAIFHVAMYDAWAAYEPDAVGVYTGTALRAFAADDTPASRAEAIGFAAYEVLYALAPAHRRKLARYFAREHGYDPDADTPAAEVGRLAARFALYHTLRDGANQLDDYADASGYSTTEHPDRWVPEAFLGDRQIPLTPHWGRVMPLALPSGDALRPPPPPSTGEVGFTDEIDYVLALSAEIGDAEKACAEYWVPWGNSPIPHLLELTLHSSRRHELDLAGDVRLLLYLSFALLDASIATWDTKYHYDYVRPATVIRALGEREVRAWCPPAVRRAFRGSAPSDADLVGVDNLIPAGVRTIPAAEWRSYLPTPPFPAYVSGHSAFTAAWAEAMRAGTASDTLDLRVRVERLWVEDRRLAAPVTLEYPTYASAAEASGRSRLYGGIHWRFDNDAGLALGREAARLAIARAAAFVDGGVRSIHGALTELMLGRGATPSGLDAAWSTAATAPLPPGDYSWEFSCAPARRNDTTAALRPFARVDAEPLAIATDIATASDISVDSASGKRQYALRFTLPAAAVVELGWVGPPPIHVDVANAQLYREHPRRVGAPRRKRMTTAGRALSW